jgi:hypothetical protein
MLALGLHALEFLFHLLLVLLSSLAYFHVLVLGFQSSVDSCFLLEVEEGISVSTETPHLISNILLMLLDLDSIFIADLFCLLLYYLAYVLPLRIHGISLLLLLFSLFLLLQDKDLKMVWFLVLAS